MSLTHGMVSLFKHVATSCTGLCQLSPISFPPYGLYGFGPLKFSGFTVESIHALINERLSSNDGMSTSGVGDRNRTCNILAVLHSPKITYHVFPFYRCIPCAGRLPISPLLHFKELIFAGTTAFDATSNHVLCQGFPTTNRRLNSHNPLFKNEHQFFWLGITATGV